MAGATDSRVAVRLLNAADAEAYRAVRIAAATHDPAAIHADAAEIAALSDSEIAGQITAGDTQRAVGAFIGGELAGVAALRRDGRAKIRHRATVQGVFTLPAHRGQGVARALLQALLDEAATLPGLLSLELAVHAENAPAKALYQAFGFRRVGLIPGAVMLDGRCLDEVLMQRPLVFSSSAAAPASIPNRDDYALIEAAPDVDTYRRLRAESGLSPKTEEAARLGLAGTAYAVQVRCGEEVVGMGRLIGDGGSFYQVVDIAVLPAHQGRGLGKRIMAAIRGHIDRELPVSAYISLIADGDAKHLYAQFGFEPTAPRSEGMALFKR
ncbi:GNAT family N-acetyltransferase [Chromobacterium subtsugae]|uniref:GNAT family N-acetyltransferase n=1 Tax=Chromobacterium subtsugae TaxID=251747 RepID=A0ABS7FKC2_9NEIS|nr:MULTISPECIES: GNAT family N-acetyltransferase [Chromobacterium]MBW7569258.1 GNAT family N-acetyltransferase [Chromobacterium subtsugae]MBW8290411.1 GNAT family N-acetyltransferase [Chromobacterium subtsugae]WSE90326.1 GNAT family N-acetyltransferase [Chromobacterium subtsugae]WVH58698.1 GNAT family N-acetyltransferase [Chromobacterium subtsugae]